MGYALRESRDRVVFFSIPKGQFASNQFEDGWFILLTYLAPVTCVPFAAFTPRQHLALVLIHLNFAGTAIPARASTILAHLSLDIVSRGTLLGLLMAQLQRLQSRSHLVAARLTFAVPVPVLILKAVFSAVLPHLNLFPNDTLCSSAPTTSS